MKELWNAALKKNVSIKVQRLAESGRFVNTSTDTCNSVVIQSFICSSWTNEFERVDSN